ncbi:MAG: atpC [Xanthobacteraceae bacterium]|jgi:F-type H+-transporting ATPase subunit epsilon|nr:atpC [Xanthobacteraceae bacterium]
MANFHFNLVSPAKLLFSGDVTQVDVPGLEGDFGVLAGHAPMVSSLRPGILTVHVNGTQEQMVVLGGFAEVSAAGLTVLADLATSVGDFDRDLLKTRISNMEESVKQMEPGNALDRAIERLDHYYKIDSHLAGTAMH